MGCCREGSGSLDKWDVMAPQQRKINPQQDSRGVWLRVTYDYQKLNIKGKSILFFQLCEDKIPTQQ